MSYKILLLDDDRLFLKSLEKALKREGYEVKALDNCREAIKEVESEFYELIITDVRMPDMNGLEFIEHVREIQKNGDQSQVMVITGYASQEVPIKAVKAQASDYITKPFETGEFLRSVKKNMEIAGLEKEKLRYTQELEESNRKLREARDLALRNERLSAIGKLASGVGHELKNPLTNIRNSVYYLQNYLNTDEPEVKEYIETLSMETEVAERILSDLLNFSKATTLARERINICDPIEEAVRTSNIPQDILVESALPDEGCFVEADYDKMKQVFQNLLSNSVSAMPDGGTITIKAECKENSVEVKLRDVGTGMNKETLERLFEPLYTTKQKGIGLGMSTVRDIIKHHKGEISVESREGEGTEFTVKLPLSQSL